MTASAKEEVGFADLQTYLRQHLGHDATLEGVAEYEQRLAELSPDPAEGLICICFLALRNAPQMCTIIGAVLRTKGLEMLRTVFQDQKVARLQSMPEAGSASYEVDITSFSDPDWHQVMVTVKQI